MKYDYKIPNVNYGYFIEQLDNGLFKLVYQKWDDGKSWNWLFPPGWAEFDNGAAQHIYKYIEDAQRDGNAFMVQNAAYKVLEIGNRYVVWFWDDKQSNASKLPVDNLIVYGDNYKELWNISEFFGRSEMCTGVHLIAENQFYFCTFSGTGNTMQIDNNEIKCIEKKLVK